MSDESARLLLISPNFPPQQGGIETLNWQIIRRLENLCRFVVASEQKGSKEWDMTAPEISILRIQQPTYPTLERLSNAIIWHLGHPLVASCSGYVLPAISLQMKHSYDLVICAHIGVAFIGYLLNKLFGVPYIIWTYGQEMLDEYLGKTGLLPIRLEKRLFRSACAVLTISHWTESLAVAKGAKASNVHKIVMGVDDYFHPCESTIALKASLSLEDKLVILSVGRLVRRKGHDMMLKSLPTIVGRFPDVVYLIVGSGPMENELRNLARVMGVSDHVAFIGAPSDELLVQYYQTADVFVMVSRELEGQAEGFGLVYLEANACGIPVVGGRSGGVTDAVVHGYTGLLVDPTSPQAIAEAIVGLFADGQYAKWLGENGRKRVESTMNWNIAASMVDETISRVLAGRKRRIGRE
jgi:phosphatidylinositol alpha-1,6-mannosyltransferase